MSLSKFLQKIRPGSVFKPEILGEVDQGTILRQAADYFSLPLERIQAEYQAYRAFHEMKGYAQSLGERKTLNFEEAFLLYLAAQRARPAQVVEIGTQYGKSTRRMIDLLQKLDLAAQVTCFDIADGRRYFNVEEARLVLHDLTGDFRQQVLEGIGPGLIYLDAHPYDLIREVVSAFIEWSPGRPAVLAIHDCSPGLYNPRMTISKSDPAEITSHTGVWERHVLADVFGAPDADLDDLRTRTHRLRIFSTSHGLALLAPIDLLGSPEGSQKP